MISLLNALSLIYIWHNIFWTPIDKLEIVSVISPVAVTFRLDNVYTRSISFSGVPNVILVLGQLDDTACLWFAEPLCVCSEGLATHQIVVTSSATFLFTLLS